MAKSIHTKMKTHKSEHPMEKFLVIVGFVGLSFFFLAHLVFSPLHTRSDLARGVLSIFAVFVLGLCLALIYEFFIKTISLQREKTVSNYSAIVSINAIFGLVFPIIFFRIVAANLMKYLAGFPKTGTLFCEVRAGILNFWRDNYVDSFLANFAFWLLVLAIALFLFGGLFERFKK